MVMFLTFKSELLHTFAIEVKWTFHLLSIYDLLIFNVDFSQLSFYICTEENANADETPGRIIQFEHKPE